MRDIASELAPPLIHKENLEPEPISSVMLAELCRLSPNACAGKPALAPPEKPFVLFF